MLSWGFKAPVCEAGPGKLIQRDKEVNGQIWETGMHKVPGWAEESGARCKKSDLL